MVKWGPWRAEVAHVRLLVVTILVQVAAFCCGDAILLGLGAANPAV